MESVGEGVTELKPGDHVLPVFTGECGYCEHCKTEESDMCNLLRINTERGFMLSDGKTRFSINGSLYTTLLEPPLSVSTRLFMLAVSRRSTLPRLLTKSVSLAAGYPQDWV